MVCRVGDVHQTDATLMERNDAERCVIHTPAFSLGKYLFFPLGERRRFTEEALSF